MILIQQNISLKPFNTFGMDVCAARFAMVRTVAELTGCLKMIKPDDGLLIIGEASNILFTSDVDGLVLRPAISGLEVLEENDRYVLVKAGAGENWDHFVEYTVSKGWGGLENLSLIPGSCGASPVQNIGAYGVEVNDFIHSVEAIDIRSHEMITLTNTECRFGYRDSIFKNELKNSVIITAVIYKLYTGHHALVTDYGQVEKELEKYPEITIHSVRQAVMAIRRSRLPDPAIIGNAGSFFKNPVISDELAFSLCRQYNTIPVYDFKPGLKKVAAAWLIEQCGWKGFRRNDTGVYPGQPLVLVNYGTATANDILALANEIKQSVNRRFAIDLQFEVNVYP